MWNPLKVFQEILQELRNLNKYTNDLRDTLVQMKDYLKDPQAIINYVDRDQKLNQIKMKEISTLYRMNNKIISADNEPVYVLSKPLATRMAETSLIPTQPNNAAYYRIGYIENLSTTAYETVDDRYPTFVDTAQILRIISTSAYDTSDGAGVQRVLVGGLNSEGDRFFEIVTLNGTIAVNTTNQFSQVDILNSVSTGSNDGAVGTVSITDAGATTTYGAIRPNDNAWKSGRVFTDDNAPGYIYQWSISAYNANVRLELMVNHIAGNIHATIARSAGVVNSNSMDYNFPIPIKVPKSSLATVRGIAKGPDCEVSTAFELYTKEEDTIYF